MDSADPRDSAPESTEPDAEGPDGEGPDGEGPDGEDAEAGEPRPTLEQRFSPWLVVRTTLHAQGFVVEVSRLFNQRVAAVDFDRLVLEPASVVKLRREVLWAAMACFGAGLLLTLPPARGWMPAFLAPALLALAALCLLAAAISPRRVTMFLDREQALHPIFLRGRRDEPLVADFVEQARRAAIAWRCRPPARDDEEPAARRPRLADTLDALLAMRQQDLISDSELQRFREMAQRR